MNTQNSTILEHLQREPITSLQAATHYGVMRLASRIHDLKMSGHAINSAMVEVKNRDGKTCRVAQYSLG